MLLLSTITFWKWKVTKTLKNVSKYYFVDKQRKMTGKEKWLEKKNGWKQLSNISFGKIIVCDACSSCHCMYHPSIHATDGFETSHFRAIFKVKNLSFFLKKWSWLVRSCRMHHDLQCLLLPSPLTNDVFSNIVCTNLR